MLFSCALAVAAGGAAGWWQWSADEPPSDAERIAAVEGVAAVEHDPLQYVVTLDPEPTAEQMSNLLSEAKTVLEASDDLYVSAESGEYYVNFSTDADQMAAVIASTEAADLLGSDVDFDEDSLSRFTFRRRDTVLAGAQRLMSGFDRAGIKDLTPLGGQLEFWDFAGTQDGDGRPVIELSTSRTDVALRRLDALARLLQRSGSELVWADIGAGTDSIKLAPHDLEALR